MGTWGIGPFDNDLAADFADELDELAEQARHGALRGALGAAAEESGYLEATDADVALAAAAVVAAARPGAMALAPAYGPEQQVPAPPPELVRLAARALDRIVGADSELKEWWDETADGKAWLDETVRLRRVLTEGQPLP
ncbi:DUF4259 domain-containing protein [Streptomyces sp. H27-D2]|uniref:DUF4259 domain-containing protein n=1 Tax=Streptomyces sp. H27-D2 TaxID=3046304 RepID=UPI002DB57C4E|nr:DUF4259 domain-containing protein [Streptomyces sp. H27-D2]MEC4019715.1 DUF4259 domain-containing protein [Streptomyces sp. H27-D2]